MRKSNKENIIAIFCADLHLSLKPPIWRSAEPDWFEAMLRPLVELRTLATLHNCPIVYAGDIFDLWYGAIGKGASELINFAMEHLPKGFAIPGQHDLPLHNYSDIKKSAYWTLEKAKVIHDIKPFTHKTFGIEKENFVLYGYPYGNELLPLIRKNDNKIHIAVIHEYKWIDGHSYLTAPNEQRLGRKKAKFTNGKWNGYDIVVYGDNHKGFMYQFPNCKTQFFNCGSFMRRHSDEIDYKPQVGLLTDRGEIKPWRLDTSKDKHISGVHIPKEAELDMTAFIQGLEELGDTALDFGEAVKRFFEKNNTSKKVIDIILEAMEKEK